MPEITSPYLNLSSYNSMVKNHTVKETPTPEYKELFDNLKTAQDKFDVYYSEHIEDFL